MASAKSGTKINTVAPANPEEAFDADLPDPLAMAEIKTEQVEHGEGKYGETPVEPFKKDDDAEDEEPKTSWIEIELLDEDDKPIPGERYEVTLPDGSVASGTLDGNGLALIERFDPGDCQICFPDLHEDAWEPHAPAGVA